jgi:hypothetical protein
MLVLQANGNLCHGILRTFQALVPSYRPTLLHGIHCENPAVSRQMDVINYYPALYL